MQTGAIFARGSCSALKWMALFGVVFALGTGSAVVQPVMTLSVPDKYELTEGGSLTVTIKASIARAAGAAATSVTVAVEGDNDTTATPRRCRTSPRPYYQSRCSDSELGDRGLKSTQQPVEKVEESGVDLSDGVS